MTIYDDVFEDLRTFEVDHKKYHNSLEDLGTFGWSQTDEIKMAISKSLTGRKKSTEHKQNLSKARLGKKLGPQSKEHKEKRIDSIRGENNGMFGIKHDANYKQAMSESTKGIRWWTDGITNVKSRICPENFRLGRTIRKP